MQFRCSFWHKIAFVLKPAQTTSYLRPRAILVALVGIGETLTAPRSLNTCCTFFHLLHTDFTIFNELESDVQKRQTNARSSLQQQV